MLPRHRFQGFRWIFGAGATRDLALAGALAITMMSHAQFRQSAPMGQQAQTALQRPVKVDIIPTPSAKLGDNLTAQIVLRDGKGQPVGAGHDMNFEVTVVQPSGSTSKSSVHFGAGESAKPVSLNVVEPGIAKFSVRQTEDALIGSSNYTLVTAPRSNAPKPKAKTAVAPSKTSKPARESEQHQKAPAQPPPGDLTLRRPVDRVPRFVLPAYATQEPANVLSPGAGDSAAKLMLKVSGENDAAGIRADGKAFARVQVFYLGSDPPPSPVKVWLRWTNGEIDVNPLVIKSDQPVAEARWTSQYAIPAAKVAIAGVYPKTQFEGPSGATVRFAEPILGIDFVNPPDRISIVDSVTLAARFFDPQGYPIQTSTKRSFRFASNTPVLRLSPEHDEVAPGASEFATVVLPISLGISQVEVSTPGYRPVSHQIKVVGLTVLLLCLVGGIVGGVLAYVNSQGSFWARVLTGVVAAAIVSWAYVYVGLPNIPAVILHSQLSVLFISLLAGFGGTKAIGAIPKAMKLGF